MIACFEHALHPRAAFGILPGFGFANAGVRLRSLSPADLLHPVPLGIIVGFLVGKQIGVMAAAGVAVGLRIVSLPDGGRWSHLYGTSQRCGIGFTMSLFIASLACEQGGVGTIGLERLSVVVGSLLAGLAGYVVPRFCLASPAEAVPPP
jgi:NhaA family Na+:H+ antiporter